MNPATGILFAVVLATNVVPDLNGSYEQQMAAVRDLPADVREFIDRRANCNHWFGEEPYDQERRAEILAALNELRCMTLDIDEAALKSRHSGNDAVFRILELSRGWSPG